MSLKAKGTNAERELVHMFWKTGNWVAHRIAGSGSSHYPSPDIIASNKLRKVALECKATKSASVYIPKEEVEGLRAFALMFGAEAWICVRFDRKEWYFLSLDDLNSTEQSYCANIELATRKGLLFEEFI
jgi:holliday junction resolvase Hjr